MRVELRCFLYFDFEGPLKAACKEAAKGPDERRKGREEDAVDLERIQVHRFLKDRPEDMGQMLKCDLIEQQKAQTLKYLHERNNLNNSKIDWDSSC